MSDQNRPVAAVWKEFGRKLRLARSSMPRCRP